MKYAMLVYQGGLANVFKVKCLNLADYGRNANRLYQGAWDHCWSFCHGLGATGIIIRTAGCNQAGDIKNSHWSDDLGSLPFADKLVNIKLN